MTVVQACGPGGRRSLPDLGASVFQPGPGDLVPCRPGSVGLQAKARSVGLSRVCPGAGRERTEVPAEAWSWWGGPAWRRGVGWGRGRCRVRGAACTSRGRTGGCCAVWRGRVGEGGVEGALAGHGRGEER